MYCFCRKYHICPGLEGAESVRQELAHSMLATFAEGGKLLVCGNGGFAAVSDHLVTELMGRFERSQRPMPAISLSASPALITCIANDFGFERVFSRQVEALGRRCDMLLAMSASGTSKNVLEALLEAQMKGMSTWVITGQTAPQALAELADHIISVEAPSTPLVQDTAMAFLHSVCAEMEREEPLAHENTLGYAAYMGQDYDTLLLDRDGVVNVLLPNAYVLEKGQMRLTPGFRKHAAALAKAYKRILVVTNQRCVGKGLLTQAELDSLHEHLKSMVADCGGRIDAFFTATGASKSDPCLKPGTGLWQEIIEKYPDIQASRCVMVGDSCGDYLFAKRLGINFLLQSYVE